MSAFEYVSPQTLDAAVAVLASDPRAIPLAGGHSVLLPANRRAIGGALLVDLRRIHQLAGFERLPDGSLRIGATTTIAALAESRMVCETVPALADAALLIGDAQVRNRATVGGNMAASDIGADLPALLLALNARIETVGPRGARELSADAFLAGPPASALDRDELIVSVIVPPPASGAGNAYEKMKHPATLFALCAVAAAVRLTPDGKVEEVRVAVTGAVRRPARLRGVEQALKGKPSPDETSILSAARVEDNELSFLTDLFASAEYRRHLTHVLTGRALQRAITFATAY